MLLDPLRTFDRLDEAWFILTGVFIFLASILKYIENGRQTSSHFVSCRWAVSDTWKSVRRNFV